MIKTPGQQLLALGVGAMFLVFLLMAGLSAMSGQSANADAVDPATKTITVQLNFEPPNLDSGATADQMSSIILGHVMEGLARLDEHNNLVPGIAERWDVRPDGATFWLRKDAKWSDGQPVTAHDFVFAWRRVVDPATASEYANIMSPLRNADAINAGKLPPSALGVEADGDWILQVYFIRPVPYFARLMAFNVFFPVREDFYKTTDGRYAADADKMLYDGPFKMTQWVHGAHIHMMKNPDYWDRDRIKINAIDIPYFTTDPNAIINLFRDGKIALAPLAQENLDEAQSLGWNIKGFQDGSIAYVEFNHRPGHITRNRNFRRAIQYTLSADSEVNKVIKIPGYIPGRSLFPLWLDGVHDKFRKEYPAPRITPDFTKARAYLAKAKKELGVKEFPPLMLLSDDTPLVSSVAQYYQDTLKRQLGLDVRIDQQIFKQRLAKARAGQFDLLMSLWGPDYADPMTFAGLFVTGNPQNRGAYSNPEYDRQVAIADNSGDEAVRMKAFAAIQDIIADDVVILPTYERTRLYVVDPRIKGVVRRVIGADTDYTNVSIVGD